MVKETKAHFIQAAKKQTPKYDYLLRHLPHVEKWAKHLLKQNPEADPDIVLISVWLHDIGQIIGDSKIDHAVNSEIETKRFLKENGYDQQKMLAIMHCVRAHRCNDVQPQSIEAKIIAAADSASHLTDIVYADMVSRGDGKDTALAKLERDYRDVSIFAELQKELTDLYEAWKNLINVFPEE